MSEEEYLPKRRSRFSTLYFILIVIVSVAAAAFLVLQEKSETSEQVYIRAQIPAGSDILKYTHTIQGFSFTRPEGYSITDLASTSMTQLNQVSILCCEPPNPRIDIFFGDHQYTDDIDPGELISSGTIIVDGVEASKTVYKRETLRGLENVTSITLKYEGMTYTLESSLGDEFNLVVRSFTLPSQE